jgi:hypothetical protein
LKFQILHEISTSGSTLNAGDLYGHLDAKNLLTFMTILDNIGQELWLPCLVYRLEVNPARVEMRKRDEERDARGRGRVR